MNYTSLHDQIASYANRTDSFFTNQIANFIQQGIQRIYSEAKNIGFEQVLIGKLVPSQATMAKPANWRETISFELLDGDNSTFLWNRSSDFCRAYWPDDTQVAKPEFYSDFANYNLFRLAPVPDLEYDFRIIYLGLPLFNTDNPMNFLTERYSRLLFYACMLEAMPFLKDDERLVQFENLYASALSDINSDTTERYSDRTSKRDKD